MGTNYYLLRSCDVCGHEDRLHIGKSSAGWCFALRVHPELGIKDLGDWQAAWSDSVIVNEYGREVDPEEMTTIITQRSSRAMRSPGWWSINDAEPGPNGLVRHRVDGVRCIAHGEGTYDLMVGDFS